MKIGKIHNIMKKNFSNYFLPVLLLSNTHSYARNPQYSILLKKGSLWRKKYQTGINKYCAARSVGEKRLKEGKKLKFRSRARTSFIRSFTISSRTVADRIVNHGAVKCRGIDENRAHFRARLDSRKAYDNETSPRAQSRVTV